MLKINRTSGRTVVFTVSGQLDSDNVNELCQVVDAEPAGGVLVLDLADLVLADRDAVRLLRQYEARGRVVLRNCPAYVRTWMAALAVNGASSHGGRSTWLTRPPGCPRV